MVARGIVHRPPILFLDEPTAGLDPQSRLALWEILGELHGDGRRSCSRRTTWRRPTSSATALAIIDHGHLLALDTPAELKTSVGADTVVTVSADGEPDALARLLGRRPR